MYTLEKQITFIYSHSHKFTTIFLYNNQPLSYVFVAFINKVVEDCFTPPPICNS